MLLNGNNFTDDFLFNFGLNEDDEITIKAHKNPRNGRIMCFTFFGNRVEQKQPFFGEISQVYETIKDARGENIDVRV